jgi:hypothetical protein
MSLIDRRVAIWCATVALIAGVGTASAGNDAAAAENRVIPRTISVSGEGMERGKPDQAQLSAGVVTQAPNAAAALSANTTAMTRVFATFRTIGIPDNKMQTANFSVQPQYSAYSSSAPDARNITGYQVSNQVSVTLDDLTKLGPALDALVRSGANQVGGVSFGIANPKPLAERARTTAVADAIAKAKTLAAAAGVTLGPLLSIQEGATASPPIPFRAMALAASAPPPVAIGEETVSVNVTLIYAIQ